MRLGITGSGGYVGTKLIKKLEVEFENIEVVKLSSRSQLLDETINNLPEIQKVILLGWDTKNRKINAQLSAAKNNIRLIKECEKREISCLFISTSLASSNSHSNYSYTKALVEQFIELQNLKFIEVTKPGLLVDSGPKTENFRHLKKTPLGIELTGCKQKITIINIEDFFNGVIFPFIKGENNVQLEGREYDVKIPLQSDAPIFIKLSGSLIHEFLGKLKNLNNKLYSIWDSYENIYH